MILDIESDSKYEDKLRETYKFMLALHSVYVDFIDNHSVQNLQSLIKYSKNISAPQGLKKYQVMLVKELEDILNAYESLDENDFDLEVLDLAAKKAESTIRSCKTKLNDSSTSKYGSAFSDMCDADTTLTSTAIESFKKNYVTITHADVIPIGSFNFGKIEHAFNTKSAAGYVQLKDQVIIAVNAIHRPMDVTLRETLEQALARLEEQTNQPWMLVVNSGISVHQYKSCVFYWAMSQHDVDKLRKCCAQSRLLLSGWSIV